MAVIGITLVFLVFLCARAEVIDETLPENYRAHVWGILNFFNSDPNRIFNYNEGTLESAQKTSNGLLLRIEVIVECRLNPTDPRCGPKILSCETLVRYNERIDRYEILPGSICHPKFEGTERIEPVGEYPVQSSSVMEVNEEPTSSVQVSHEVIPENGAGEEEFVAVRRDSSHCLGCVIDLDKNVEGLPALISTALKHVESERDKKHVLLDVLRVQQQVVAGIKFILLLKIAPTICSKEVETVTLESCPVDETITPQICHIIYLQKPWISLQKHIITNNCTISQEFSDINQPVFPEMKRSFFNDHDNEIDVSDDYKRQPNDALGIDVPNFDTIANMAQVDGENSRTVNPSALADIESQIEFQRKPKEENSSLKQENDDKTIAVTSEAALSDLSPNLDSIQQKQEPPSDTSNLKNSEDSMEVQSTTKHFEDKQVLLEKMFLDNLNKRRERKKRSSPNWKKVDSKSLARKLAEFVTKEKFQANANVLQIFHIDKSKNNKLGGNLYSLLFEVAPESGQSETCKAKVLIPRNKSDIAIRKFKCYNVKGRKLSRNRRQIPGAVIEASVSDPKITGLTQDSLLYLNTNSGQPNKFKVVEIISASKQVVAGILYRIKAKIIMTDCQQNDLKDPQLCVEREGESPRLCDFVVWDRPWLPQGRQTNITCENDIEFSYKTKRSVRSKRSSESNYESHHYKDESPNSNKRNNYDFVFYLFEEFRSKFNRTYANKKEFKYRFKVFRENLEVINLLNRYEQGTGQYGVTMFADLTTDEFRKYTGYRPDLKSHNEVPFIQAEIPDMELPVEFDWRSKGAVTEVKNQGSCGSCWAFSVTGNVEGQYAIKYGKLLEFSEQELLDCDSMDEGCNGGLMDNAYRAIEKLGGLETERDYPYDARDDETCNFHGNLAKVRLSGAVNISTNEDDMARWLVKNGPISIAINANAMQFYIGGVSHPWKFLCNPKDMDHGVLIVGYGEHKYPYLKKTLPYWLVKNSWGRSWGEQGYYLVYRGDGTCGVNQTPSSAVVA